MLSPNIKKYCSFLLRYVYALLMLPYVMTVGQRRVRHRKWVRRLAAHMGLRDGVKPYYPSKKLYDLCDPAQAVEVYEAEPQDGNVSLHELYVINALVRRYQPQTIFEIGTFDGRTTLNMAANAPANAQVFTLDLPREALGDTALPIKEGDQIHINKEGSGARFAQTRWAQQITQLFGDSAQFDFAPYHHQCDMVFVDGAHSFEYVMRDSVTARSLLRDGKGVIIWHDAIMDGVGDALNQLFCENEAFSTMFLIQNTSLAVCVFE